MKTIVQTYDPVPARKTPSAAETTAWQRLRQNRLAMASLGVVMVFTALAMYARLSIAYIGPGTKHRPINRRTWRTNTSRLVAGT